MLPHGATGPDVWEPSHHEDATTHADWVFNEVPPARRSRFADALDLDGD